MDDPQNTLSDPQFTFCRPQNTIYDPQNYMRQPQKENDDITKKMNDPLTHAYAHWRLTCI
jgi:hypothetical protein